MAELEKEGGGGAGKEGTGTGKKSPHSDTLSSSPQRIIQETLLPPVMSPVSGTEKPHDPVRHAREASHLADAVEAAEAISSFHRARWRS